MKLNAAIVALLGLSVAVPVAARTIVEAGTEYEQYFNECDKLSGKQEQYEKLNAYVPYIKFSYAPNSNEWNLSGRYLRKEYPNEDMFGTAGINLMTERYELFYIRAQRTGDLRLRYGAGVRYNGYEIDRYETEYRLYPQFDYFLNANNQLFLNGHYYLGDSRGRRSGDESAQNYTDWGYEAEFGLIHKINAVSFIKPSIYTEFDSYENNYDVDLWQLRLVYTRKIGRMVVNPFVRIGLGRDTVERSHVDPIRWGNEMDKNYSRYGVYGSLGISGRLSLNYETYWQVENNEYFKVAGDHPNGGEVLPLPDRDKFFAKLGVQYVF
ncbi:hypothetical protein [Vibrio taketomensis]|uniref:hypothetical protein n=1 Tax=Vibrio taketomensis TaxID=2572923 RepID=UPI00138A551C|nr:hypothetical protein [Vibrio taketomensis]